MEPEIINIEECEKLIRTYKYITLRTIREKWLSFPASHPCSTFAKRAETVANALTGYGFISNCTLCKATQYYNASNKINCDICIHKIAKGKGHRYYCVQNKTYDAIDDANSPEKLKKAFNERAKYLESLLNKYHETRSQKSKR